MSRNTFHGDLSERTLARTRRRRRPRRSVGGRKHLSDHDPGLVKALEFHLEPATRGDPESPLRWTSLSARRLADALSAEGHPVSERTVNRLLHSLVYSLQSNRKTVEGRQHPNRNAQFRRHDGRQGPGQRRHRPRHRVVRGGKRAAVVAEPLPGKLSTGSQSA